MNRRSFLVRVGGALVAVPAALHVVACGDDGNGNGGGGPDAGPATSFTVANSDVSHPHTFTVQCDQLTSSAEVTFTAGGSGHPHSVTVSADQLATIAAGGTVTIQTSDGGHPHTWDISKPSNACA